MVTRRELLCKFREKIKRYLDKNFTEFPVIATQISSFVTEYSDEAMVLAFSCIKTDADIDTYENDLMNKIKSNGIDISKIEPEKIDKLREYMRALAKFMANAL